MRVEPTKKGQTHSGSAGPLLRVIHKNSKKISEVLYDMTFVPPKMLADCLLPLGYLTPTRKPELCRCRVTGLPFGLPASRPALQVEHVQGGRLCPVISLRVRGLGFSVV